MLVLVLVIVGFVLFRDLNRAQPEGPVEAVDYQQSAAYADDQAGFDVLTPEQLPEGWKATSVEFVPRPVRWHLGLLTDEGEYVGLEQSESSVEDMVTTYVDDAPERGGEVPIDGKVWRSWTDDEGDSALVRTDDGVVTLVVGPAEREVLVGFVRSLR